MKTAILYDEAKAKEVENAIIEVYGCRLNDIVGFIDTSYKKIAVFVLFKLLEYDKRNIAHAYSITYLYIPTVVDEIEFQFLMDKNLREKLSKIVKIIGYESRSMDGNRIEFTS